MSGPVDFGDMLDADDQRYQDMLSEAYRAAMDEAAAPAGSGWERHMYASQLSDANKRIAELEQECARLREDFRKLMHAAAHLPVIEEAPAEFPANCLRWSV